MEKVIEFNMDNEELKKYLEECFTEEKINYELKIEDRWIQRVKQVNKYYQVYCIYVDNKDLDKAKKIIEEYENATIITDDIEEFKNVEEETDEKYKKFTKKNFLKYYWCALIIIGILIIIGAKFF